MLLAGVLSGVPAAAQAPEPPGPWVIDVRGATSGLPKDTAFFPGIPLETIVPARGFGLDAGGHVYLFSLGPARLGAGAGYLLARGTAPGVATVIQAVLPQLSFNFGSSEGWSYLSAGLGRAWVETELTRDTGTTTADSGGLTAQHIGGGARWFLTRRLGVGFDVRFVRINGPPRTTLVSASVGFSVK